MTTLEMREAPAAATQPHTNAGIMASSSHLVSALREQVNLFMVCITQEEQRRSLLVLSSMPSPSLPASTSPFLPGSTHSWCLYTDLCDHRMTVYTSPPEAQGQGLCFDQS